MSTWKIFCPGPSLKHWVNEIDPGFFQPTSRSIAVNGAILGVSCGYWAVMDYHVVPSVLLLADNVDEFMSGVVLWCPEKLITETQRYRPDVIQTLDGFEKSFFPKISDLCGPGSMDPEMLWHTFTLVAAIAKALHEGAREILIYGADMQGAGYFDSRLDSEHDTHSTIRWGEECRVYRIVEKFCRERGIKLIRKKTYYS